MAWFWDGPVVSGVVIDKHSYAPGGAVSSAPVNKQNAIFVEGLNGLATQSVSPAGWSLIVRGKNAKGKIIQKEEYVDPLVWSTTEIGARWPLISKA